MSGLKVCVVEHVNGIWGVYSNIDTALEDVFQDIDRELNRRGYQGGNYTVRTRDDGALIVGKESVPFFSNYLVSVVPMNRRLYG